jgi:hypothetical protein
VKTPPSPNTPIYPLGLRVAAKVLLAIPAVAGFTVMLAHHKGLIDIEQYGVPEAYLYGGTLVVIFGALGLSFLFWRCPGCRAYLGKSFSPTSCPKCGAKFQ